MFYFLSHLLTTNLGTGGLAFGLDLGDYSLSNLSMLLFDLLKLFLGGDLL